MTRGPQFYWRDSRDDDGGWWQSWLEVRRATWYRCAVRILRDLSVFRDLGDLPRTLLGDVCDSLLASNPDAFTFEIAYAILGDRRVSKTFRDFAKLVSTRPSSAVVWSYLAKGRA